MTSASSSWTLLELATSFNSTASPAEAFDGPETTRSDIAPSKHRIASIPLAPLVVATNVDFEASNGSGSFFWTDQPAERTGEAKKISSNSNAARPNSCAFTETSQKPFRRSANLLPAFIFDKAQPSSNGNDAGAVKILADSLRFRRPTRLCFGQVAPSTSFGWPETTQAGCRAQVNIDVTSCTCLQSTAS